MTPPGKADLKIYKGAALDEVFYVKDVDADGVETVTDLTGYTAKAQGREAFDSASTFFDLTTENGGITITGSEGKIRIYIAATTTDDITVTEGYWDLLLIPPSGAADTIRLLQGEVCISNWITHS